MKGYKESFNPRQYHIMIEREQNGRTFKSIGQELGIGKEWARQLYLKGKTQQKKLYFKVIQKDNGLSNEDMNHLIRSIETQFNLENEYIVAYLEYNYYDILDAYRKDEPKSRFNVSDYTPREYKDKEVVIEKWRHELTQEEMELLQAADSGQSTKELAASRYISEKDVENKLRTAKQARFRDAVHKLCEDTGLTFDDVYWRYSYPQDPFDKRYADLMEQLRKAQAGEPVILPLRY